MMDKKIRVLMAYEVPGLDEVLGNKDSIWLELNDYLKTIIAKINTQDLGEWRLLINVNLNATNGLGVFKRIRRYPSDREFEISIIIPVPNESQAPYGTSKVNEAFYKTLDVKKFYTLDPQFEKYKTLHQYFYESSKSAIDLAFTHGFTCNGKKIKFQK